MFSRAENASKTALLVFSQVFSQDGGKLIDCQVLNKHTASLGAVEIPRRDYRLSPCCGLIVYRNYSGYRGCYLQEKRKCFQHIFVGML